MVQRLWENESCHLGRNEMAGRQERTSRQHECLQARLAVSAQPSRLGVMNHRNAALAATCHCGAIRIYVRQKSRTLTSCNCSICRRYGALWAYYAASSVTIKAPKGGLAKYSWNRKIRAYYRCKKCGCVTHYTYRKKRRNTTVAVNAVNFEPSALIGVRIRHLDGAASWKFLD
jgi:hypothetical protein